MEVAASPTTVDNVSCAKQVSQETILNIPIPMAYRSDSIVGKDKTLVVEKNFAKAIHKAT